MHATNDEDLDFCLDRYGRFADAPFDNVEVLFSDDAPGCRVFLTLRGQDREDDDPDKLVQFLFDDVGEWRLTPHLGTSPRVPPTGVEYVLADGLYFITFAGTGRVRTAADVRSSECYVVAAEWAIERAWSPSLYQL